MQPARSLIGRIARRLRSRPDSEHEMRFNGVIFGTAILIYVLATAARETGALIVPPPYIAYNLAVLGHILWRPAPCRPRRILSVLSDFTALFWVMHIGGESTAVLFPIYLWVILGNGFRFGLPFLALATAGGVASYSAVVATTPFWSSQAALSAGLFGGIILVPLAAVPLIRQLSKAKQRAEAASREASLILASVSHELRPPLTAILGTGSVLQDTKLDPTQRKIAGRVISAGERLRTLVDDISDASRIEARPRSDAKKRSAAGEDPTSAPLSQP